MIWAKIKQVEESLLFQILLKMYKNGNICSPCVMVRPEISMLSVQSWTHVGQIEIMIKPPDYKGPGKWKLFLNVVEEVIF